MDTPWWTRGVGQEAADKLRNVVQAAMPLRVASRPEDVAEVVTFLAGPGSRYMTKRSCQLMPGFTCWCRSPQRMPAAY
jgi:3-oxoacyl-[acyl-carrier protein] reductase